MKVLRAGLLKGVQINRNQPVAALSDTAIPDTESGSSLELPNDLNNGQAEFFDEDMGQLEYFPSDYIISGNSALNYPLPSSAHHPGPLELHWNTAFELDPALKPNYHALGGSDYAMADYNGSGSDYKAAIVSTTGAKIQIKTDHPVKSSEDVPELKNDWRASGLIRHSLSAPGRLVMPIDPVVSTRIVGEPYYLFESSVLRAFGARLLDMVTLDLNKLIPKFVPTESFPYREALGRACFVCEGDDEMAGLLETDPHTLSAHEEAGVEIVLNAREKRKKIPKPKHSLVISQPHSSRRALVTPLRKFSYIFVVYDGWEDDGRLAVAGSGPPQVELVIVDGAGQGAGYDLTWSHWAEVGQSLPSFFG
ncbi:hypothetical protein DFH09DRAFT_1372284 [Mycena vulgaris]|nr:hypothetical protein DFH09DRAFT_1372284 [Mycena vulgaris]